MRGVRGRGKGMGFRVRGSGLRGAGCGDFKVDLFGAPKGAQRQVVDQRKERERARE